MKLDTIESDVDPVSINSIILSIFIGFFVLSIICIIARHYKLESDLRNKTNGIPIKPFSKILPLIGDLSLILDPINYQENHIPKYGKIFGTYLFDQYFIMIESPELFEQVYYDHAKDIQVGFRDSINKLFGYRGIHKAVGDDHKKQRRMILNYVGVPSLNRLYPGFVQIFNKYVNSWVERTKDDSYIDIVPELSKAVWEAISFVVIGDDLPQEMVDELRAAMDDFGKGVSSLPIDLPFTAFGKSVAAGKKFRKLLLQEYKRRQSMPDQGFNRKDFFQALINETANQGFPEGFNIDTAVIVIWASLDTTKGTSVRIINTMIDHAKEWERVRLEVQKSFGNEGILAPDVTYSRICEEVPFIGACVKEVMRLEGILLHGMRKAVNDFEISFEGNKFIIPANARIVSSFHYYHRDENSTVFNNPTSFIPERYMGAESEERNPKYKAINVTFGLGERLCPGSPIAKLEMEVLLALMSKFKWIRRERVKDWKMLPFPMPENGFWIKAVPIKQ